MKVKLIVDIKRINYTWNFKKGTIGTVKQFDHDFYEFTTENEFAFIIHADEFEFIDFKYEKLKKELEEVRKVAFALREYIDAIPKEIEFEKTMPGVDRDWADEVLDYRIFQSF